MPTPPFSFRDMVHRYARTLLKLLSASTFLFAIGHTIYIDQTFLASVNNIYESHELAFAYMALSLVVFVMVCVAPQGGKWDGHLGAVPDEKGSKKRGSWGTRW